MRAYAQQQRRRDRHNHAEADQLPGLAQLAGPAGADPGPGASATFTATLTVPTSAIAYQAEKLKITATSSRFPGHQPADRRHHHGQAGRAAELLRRRGPAAGAGETLTFRHSLVNTGNYGDRFTITATQAYNWNITVVPTTTATLQPGVNRLVTVTVRVPSDAAVTAKNLIVLRATSAYSPTVRRAL